MFVMISCFLVVQALVLSVFGQPWICDCGYVQLWAGDIFSSDNSQHLFDWYTFSHILHGIIFYCVIRKLFPKFTVFRVVFWALVLEVGWELLENTPWVINHYRESALAQGYTGDSIVNSLADTGSMLFGVFLARVLRWWQLVVVFFVFELGTLYMVRDNLMLNVMNLTFPSERVQQWQLDK